jgi:hypothetical protein
VRRSVTIDQDAYAVNFVNNPAAASCNNENYKEEEREAPPQCARSGKEAVDIQHGAATRPLFLISRAL